LGGINVSAAGAPLAQTKGSEIERFNQDLNAQQRHVQTEKKAEAAAGIGETDDGDLEANERDADGRLPWKRPEDRKKPDDENPESPPPPSRDATGQSGNQLDLSG
jgi:hypothetical protein